MKVERWDQKVRESVVWNWDWVKDFPGILCKQLLWPDDGYFAGWATFDGPEEFLTLQLRDHGPSKCLTPAGCSHQLGDVLKRMDENHWTFDRLASDDISQEEVRRNQDWFQKCVDLEAKFDVAKLGLLAVHPREGFKERALKDGIFDAAHHEIYEGLHRALILAKKLRDKAIAWPSPKTIYLFPDRET